MSNNKNLKIGDKVWLAICGNEEVKLTCPCCFGQLKVKVILGNDEIVEVPCDACGLGYQGPRGIINEYKWIAKVESNIISELKGEMTSEGFKIDSIYCGCSDLNRRYFSDTNDIFYTEEEAIKRCEEKIKEHEEEVNKKLTWSKEKANKGYAWHVRYHQKEARDAERKLKWHSERAVYCKKLAKTEVKKDELTKKYLEIKDCPI